MNLLMEMENVIDSAGEILRYVIGMYLWSFNAM